MKIKRKEYERLTEAASKLGDLEHIWIIQRVRLENGTTPEILRMPLTDYVAINVIDEDTGFTWAKPWVTGPTQLEFVRVYSGFERYLFNLYGCMMSSPQTAELGKDTEQ